MNPIAGQRFRSLDSISVRGLIHLRAPATGSFAGILPPGEVVVVDLEPPAHATAVSVRPLRYRELELSLVPSEDRADPKYASYSLVIPLELLLKGFEPVPNGTFIVLLDEPGLFVFQTAADAAGKVEAIDAEASLRAAFDDQAVPYKVDWLRPNRRVKSLGLVSRIQNGEYRFVPAGPADPDALALLLENHSKFAQPPESRTVLVNLLSSLKSRDIESPRALPNKRAADERSV